jgi:hypothetical protein
MLKYVPAVLAVTALFTMGCEDEARVRVREPRAQVVVAAPREVIVAQPRAEVVTVQAQPQVVEEEVIAESGPPVEHIRVAPQVVYGGRRVYWWGNRWYYQNGARWGYYRNEPVYLRGRRY